MELMIYHIVIIHSHIMLNDIMVLNDFAQILPLNVEDMINNKYDEMDMKFLDINDPLYQSNDD